MRVRIQEVCEHNRVRFSCDVGELLLTSEENRYVSAGVVADLELDVDVVLKLGSNAFVTTEESYAVENAGGLVHLRGVVDGVDDDGLI